MNDSELSGAEGGARSSGGRISGAPSFACAEAFADAAVGQLRPSKWRLKLFVACFLLAAGFVLPLTAGADCSSWTARPLIISFLGFNESPGQGSDTVFRALAQSLGADVIGPYVQSQNPLSELERAIADVLAFEGQPLDLVKKPLTAALRLGKAIVHTAGLPVIASAELQRARKDLREALESSPDRPVYVLAYSWGTVPARLLLPKLRAAGANVQRIVLLEPVHVLHPKTTLSPIKVFDPTNRRLEVPEEYRNRITVIYQRGDPVIHGGLVAKIEDIPDQEDMTATLQALYPECAGTLVACLHSKLPVAPPVLERLRGLIARPSVIEFSNTSYSVSETDPSVTITVKRTGDLGCAASVRYATANGTATAGSDYRAVSGTLVFAPGDTEKPFVVPIMRDFTEEPTESINLALSSPFGAASLGQLSTAVVNVVNVCGGSLGTAFVRPTFFPSTLQTLLTAAPASGTLELTISGVVSMCAPGRGYSYLFDYAFLFYNPADPQLPPSPWIITELNGEFRAPEGAPATPREDHTYIVRMPIAAGEALKARYTFINWGCNSGSHRVDMNLVCSEP
jgi:hypothetical protein